MSDLSAFDKARKAALRVIDAHESASVSNMLSLVDALRLAIIARMAESALQANDVRGLQTLQLTLDLTIAEYQRRMSEQIAADVAIGAEAGASLIDAPLVSAGVSLSPYVQPTAAIEAAQMFALDRVKDLTADARTTIANILRRVLGGAIGINDGIKEVGASLNSKGVFKSFAARADLIVRQEILTVQSQAAQARMTERAATVAQAGYQLLKSWLDAGDERVRDTHAQAADDYAVDGEPGPVAVDESFNIDGALLLFPRDPSGPLDEIMNCRCTAQPVLIRAA
jgi:hypothetical protein